MRCSTILLKSLRGQNGNSIFFNLIGTLKYYARLLFKEELSSSYPFNKNIEDSDALIHRSHDFQENIDYFISSIRDPLWKNICKDLIKVMGSSSVLKIEKVRLGKFYSQDFGIDVICDTEETAKFVRQYDFVILGSLYQYFPDLKELRVKIEKSSFFS